MEEENNKEKIGFHKGAINTLIKEHQELKKMANVVSQLVQVHIKELKRMGIDITNKEDKKLDGKV